MKTDKAGQCWKDASLRWCFGPNSACVSIESVHEFISYHVPVDRPLSIMTRRRQEQSRCFKVSFLLVNVRNCSVAPSCDLSHESLKWYTWPIILIEFDWVIDVGRSFLGFYIFVYQWCHYDVIMFYPHDVMMTSQLKFKALSGTTGNGWLWRCVSNSGKENLFESLNLSLSRSNEAKSGHMSHVTS